MHIDMRIPDNSLYELRKLLNNRKAKLLNSVAEVSEEDASLDRAQARSAAF